MIINKEFAKELALSLLEINAVVLRPNDPFRWTSGWNSPIYCDNRLILGYPELRSKVADEISGFMKINYTDTEVVSGTATAGIPHAAWVADRLNKPMAYVRGKAKQHGTANQIEGGIKKGQSTVIIEDLISTGESSISAADILKFVGAEPVGVISIFHYGFDRATQRFEENNLPVHSLTDYHHLIQAAVRFGFVAQDDLETLNKWRSNPDTWPK